VDNLPLIVENLVKKAHFMQKKVPALWIILWKKMAFQWKKSGKTVDYSESTNEN